MLGILPESAYNHHFGPTTCVNTHNLVPAIYMYIYNPNIALTYSRHIDPTMFIKSSPCLCHLYTINTLLLPSYYHMYLMGHIQIFVVPIILVQYALVADNPPPLYWDPHIGCIPSFRLITWLQNVIHVLRYMVCNHQIVPTTCIQPPHCSYHLIYHHTVSTICMQP